jgi:hypothetical protein
MTSFIEKAESKFPDLHSLELHFENTYNYYERRERCLQRSVVWYQGISSTPDFTAVDYPRCSRLIIYLLTAMMAR